MRKLAAGAAVCLALSAAARAQTVIYVDADAAGLSDGSSWTDAFTDLQDALAAAASGDEIWVAEGTYRPTDTRDRTISFQLVEGVGVYGGFAGTEIARAERDPTAHLTVLSGDIGTPDDRTDNSYHVLVGASNATLDGFTVLGGNANGDSAFGTGGGMHNHSVSGLELANCVLTGNRADGGGAGAYSYASSLILVNCVFSGNKAGDTGSALRNWSDSSVEMRNCTFAGNRGSSVAVFSWSTYDGGGSLTAANCNFWDNPGGDLGISVDVGVVIHCNLERVHSRHDAGGNINADPRFVDPGHWDDNGTPADGSDDFWVEGDYRLQPGSPCIDAADGDAALAVDIQGLGRHDDPGMFDLGAGTPTYADIGAYEFQGTTPDFAEVYTPASRSHLLVGSQVDITWLIGGGTTDVKIELSRGGGPWEEIAASTPNDRSYTWTVTAGTPALPQANCVIRVSDQTDGSPAGTLTALVVRELGVLHVDQDPSPGGDGLSWLTAYRNPQEALARSFPGDEIWVAEGVYRPTDTGDRTVSFELVEGVALYGGFTGTETSREERDWKAHETVLSGDLAGDDDPTKPLDDPARNNGENSYHVVMALSAADGAVLDGFTVTAGNADGESADEYAAGLRAISVDLMVVNCTFHGNSARYGGAMEVGVFSNVVIMSCEFCGNSADRGGGVATNWDASLHLTDCLFSGNSASQGGAVYSGMDFFVMSGCSLQGNAAGSGGAVYVAGDNTTVVNCTFRANTASRGGAIYASTLLK